MSAHILCDLPLWVGSSIVVETQHDDTTPSFELRVVGAENTSLHSYDSSITEGLR